MTWKVSKKQADLKRQLKSSLKVYTQASKALNQMLLKMLHRDGVYTPDDFHRKYIARKVGSDNNKVGSASPYQQQFYATGQQISQNLVHLSSALMQLRETIKRRSASKYH